MGTNLVNFEEYKIAKAYRKNYYDRNEVFANQINVHKKVSNSNTVLYVIEQPVRAVTKESYELAYMKLLGLTVEEVNT
ncbi:hypothetical protein FZC83_02110 [Rossellomorea marisflavi]|uniref:Uncharacterized protein n=1 Tax=Rossellomorea marisflavi TaxID=189381 RepID=A0A5D4RZJ6_9BACI|nr:hypothetical protein [Rossellomorea marisflavi]TYS56390.1 hypothetical protein FZC83_02110 [Rossellomorea marisflavi]